MREQALQPGVEDDEGSIWSIEQLMSCCSAKSVAVWFASDTTFSCELTFEIILNSFLFERKSCEKSNRGIDPF